MAEYNTLYNGVQYILHKKLYCFYIKWYNANGTGTFN